MLVFITICSVKSVRRSKPSLSLLSFTVADPSSYRKKNLKNHKANNKDISNGVIGTDREQVTLVMFSYEPNGTTIHRIYTVNCILVHHLQA
jgi:hypothetical protein